VVSEAIALSKPIKNAVAIILRSSSHPGSFLAVQRPGGVELAGYWGLPATPMHKDELPEDAARRVCREKLDCNAVPLRLVGTMFQKRKDYDIFFMDFEMLLTSNEPDVSKAQTDSTIYADQKWTNELQKLLPAAQNGSCCSTIFLTDQGVMDRNAWMESLESI
jgi:ADP-ribose pyrophosphatase YjhB (NUDIX family)